MGVPSVAVAGAGQVSSYHAVMPVMKVIKAAPELGDLPCSHGAVRPGNRVNKRLHACLLRLKSISPSVHEHDWSMCPATAGAAPPRAVQCLKSASGTSRLGIPRPYRYPQSAKYDGKLF